MKTKSNYLSHCLTQVSHFWVVRLMSSYVFQVFILLAIVGFLGACSGDSNTDPAIPIEGSFTYQSIVDDNPQGGSTPNWTNALPEQTVTYTIEPSNESAVINAETGVVSISTTKRSRGSNTYTVTAQGNGRYTGTLTSTVSVTIKDSIGESFTYDPIVDQIPPGGGLPNWSNPVDGQTMTYSIAPSDAGIRIDANTGKLTMYKTPPDANTYTVTAKGTGLFSGSLTATVSIKSRELILGGFFYPNGVIHLLEGGSTNISLRWYSGTPEDQTVTYSIAPIVNGVSIDPNTGVVSVSTAAKAFSNTFTITAQGSGNYFGSQMTTVSILVWSYTIGPFSYPSVVAYPGDTNITVTPVWYSASPSQTVTYSAPASTGGVSVNVVNSTTGALSISVGTSVPVGTNTYTITAQGVSPYTGTSTGTVSVVVKSVVNLGGGGTATVNSVAWSPDGNRLASGSGDNTVKIWDPNNATATPTTLAGHTGPVNSVAWNNDGTRLASGSGDNSVKVWNNTGTLVTNFTWHSEGVNSVAWSHDGNRLASGSQDKTIKIWHKTNGSVVSNSSTNVYTLAWSSDGAYLLSAGANTFIRLWDPNTGGEAQDVNNIVANYGSIHSIALNRKSEGVNHLASSGSLDKDIKIFGLSDNFSAGANLLRTITTRHTDIIYSIAWNPSGTRLATGSGDGTIKIWNPSTGELIRSLPRQGAIHSIAWNPTGTRLASAGANDTIKIWDVSGL